ncbi:MAG: helix-turn-helix domain-containing protein [Planctomycetota bacterium]|nr:MAG: helix-turn-helix domain-containing protein [Planctomycetota bacterium]
MPTVAFFVESLIAPHGQVLAGLEGYRKEHSLDWSIVVVTQGSHIPKASEGPLSYLTIHPRLLTDEVGTTAEHPALGIFAGSDERYHSCVDLDGATFGDLAARHFCDIGLRHAAYIPAARAQGRQHFASHYQGLREGCRANGIICEELPPGSADGDQALCAALRQHVKPLGIYCATDAQAAWLRERCLQEGLGVPDEIAILGTSDHPHHCERRHPTISSIAFPWFLMGRSLGQALHRQLSGQARPEPQLLRPVRVVERESTAGQLPTDPLVAAALSWLQRHLREPQPLAACAAAQGCSVPTLARRFRRVLGASVKQVHARMRHREAMRLLSTSETSLTSIAQTCGYADAAALSIAFKRHSGWSPGRWRLAARS